MRRLVVILAVGIVTLVPHAASAAPPEGAGENVPEGANENCGDVIEFQSDTGVEAGGGPKAGIVAPTNCDWFFFAIGAIGGSD